MNVLEQRRAALVNANAIRFEHLRIREEVAALDRVASRALAAQIIRNPEGRAQSLRVLMLLRACPRVGDVTIRRWFLKSGVVASARLKDIPPGKREALAKLVEE